MTGRRRRCSSSPRATEEAFAALTGYRATATYGKPQMIRIEPLRGGPPCAKGEPMSRTDNKGGRRGGAGGGTRNGSCRDRRARSEPGTKGADARPRCHGKELAKIDIRGRVVIARRDARAPAITARRSARANPGSTRRDPLEGTTSAPKECRTRWRARHCRAGGCSRARYVHERSPSAGLPTASSISTGRRRYHHKLASSRGRVSEITAAFRRRAMPT